MLSYFGRHYLTDAHPRSMAKGESAKGVKEGVKLVVPQPSAWSVRLRIGEMLLVLSHAEEVGLTVSLQGK